jgi:hypothetical protein
LGLAHLRHDDWLIHLDADTALPHRFRYLLNTAKPEKDCIYGADRLYVQNYDQWKTVQHRLVPQWQDGCHVMPHGDFKMCSRLLHGDYGYCPIGYFQMWHSSQHRTYPGSAGTSEHSDVLFALQWPRVKRVLLPQLFCYHLASENAPMGANWNGRTTKPFCPCHAHQVTNSPSAIQLGPITDVKKK